MAIFYNCIHWRVCALPCPLDVEECRHFKAEGDEVKHGHWYKKVNSEEALPHCSQCHKANDGYNYYCSHCGAKMDEGSEE